MMIDSCTSQPPAYYYEMVAPYRDKYGLITQLDESMDGGDAAHRAGVFYFGLYLKFKDSPAELKEVRSKFLTDLNKLKISTGKFVRHPDPSKWYSNPDNFSRDQTMSLIIALGAFNEVKEVQANFDQLISSNGFFPNKLKNWTNEEKHLPFDYRDISAPSDWGMYIRALKKKEYYLALYFADLQLLGNALVRIVISYFDDRDTSDDVNFTLLLLQSELSMPTFISRSSAWIYSKYRKVSPFTKVPNNQNAVASAWEYYFSRERPPLNKVYECALTRFNNNDSIKYDRIHPAQKISSTNK